MRVDRDSEGAKGVAGGHSANFGFGTMVTGGMISRVGLEGG